MKIYFDALLRVIITKIKFRTMIEVVITSGFLVGSIGLYIQWHGSEIERRKLELDLSKANLDRQEENFRLAKETCELHDGELLDARLKGIKALFPSSRITQAFCLEYRGAKGSFGHFVRPVNTSEKFAGGFGARIDPFTGHIAFHPGVDFTGKNGDPVFAAADGVVNFADIRGGYGKLVIIDHGREWRTRYGHLSEIDVAPSQIVVAGQKIGAIGTTGSAIGPHLHFEVWWHDRVIDPIDHLPVEPSGNTR